MKDESKWVAGYFVAGTWLWHKSDGMTRNVAEALCFDTRGEANLAPRFFAVMRVDQALAVTAANPAPPDEDSESWASSEELLKILAKHLQKA